MFRRTPDHIHISPLLETMTWLDHGFGARQAGDWIGGGATLRQVHSDTVVEACASGRLGDGDALITDRAGLWLGVRTADCYPVILADPGRRAVAVVHSGWRGTAAAIVSRTVEALSRRFGSRPEELIAAVGPGIGGCCYEVGAEVAERFQSQGGACRKSATGRYLLDLAVVLQEQLREAGVGRVEAAGLCTQCGDGFWSFRRDGEAAGRMVSGVSIRPE